MDALRPYEEHLRRIHFSGYAKNLTTRVFDALKAVLDEVTGRANVVHSGCAACVADMLHQLATWYYDTVEVEQAAAVADLKAKAAARDATYERMKFEEIRKLEAKARAKMEAAEARYAEAVALKEAIEAQQAAAAAAAPDAGAETKTDTPDGGGIVDDGLPSPKPETEPAPEKPAAGAEAGQISASSPEPGEGTGKTGKAAKSAGKSKNVKPKTN